MRCPSAGSSVRLMLEEATGSSTRIGALVPAAGATVKGDSCACCATASQWHSACRGITTRGRTVTIRSAWRRSTYAPTALRGEARLTADYA